MKNTELNTQIKKLIHKEFYGHIMGTFDKLIRVLMKEYKEDNENILNMVNFTLLHVLSESEARIIRYLNTHSEGN